ncbi:MAG: hypothetical protein P8Y18_09855 [Candidatus Bathyarchaeota archaeon]
MSKKVFVFLVLLILVIVVVYFVVVSFNNSEYLSKTKHETDNWVVIVDSKQDVLAVETSDPNVWQTFSDLYENQTEMWIGGIIEQYDNFWGFRFKPDSIVVAQITVEGAQSNIKAISENLNYWINIWSKQAYVLAKVNKISDQTTIFLSLNSF